MRNPVGPLVGVVSLILACVGCGGDTAPPVQTPGGSSRVPATTASAAPAPLAAVDKPLSPIEAAFPAAFPHRRANVAEGTRGMVVSDAPLATKVGADVLSSGGNASDAAVALAFALAVVFPTAGNIGGGGFAVTRTRAGAGAGSDTFEALDFRETAPLSAKVDLYGENAGGMSAPSRFGHRASGVPGSVAGLYALHEKLGSKKKKWAELLAPAIRFAEEGFVVDADFVESIQFVAERLKKFPASASLFLPGGAPPKVGATLKNPDLAKVLRRIADTGPRGFYEGATAQAIAAEMKRGGGHITLEDLKRYRAKWRNPVTFDYRGHRVVSMPPPSSGGLTLQMMSAILEPYPMREMPWRSPKEIHLLMEASRRAFAARNARLGDPDFVKNPVEELTSKAWADAQRASIREDRATPSASLGIKEKGSGAGPHTTHFSVVDRDGNVVALTTTINWWFGSAVTVEGGGFLLNNEMDDFAVIPGTANTFGLVQGEPNVIAPGKRMLSSMAPTLVFGTDGQLKLVLGAAGGPTIISAVMQIMSSVIDHEVPLDIAEAAPRFHHQGLPDVMTIEKNGLTPSQKSALEGMGHAFKERDHIADAPSIGWIAGAGAGTGKWIGAPEPRRTGTVAIAPTE